MIEQSLAKKIDYTGTNNPGFITKPDIGLSQMPCNSNVGVGTLSGDIYNIEPSVTHATETYTEYTIERGDSMNTNMSLYEVIVVGKNKDIYIDRKVVAESAKDAEFEAGVDLFLREWKLKPSDVNIICTWKANIKIEDKDK